jgi:hypothetical protein
MGKLTDAILQLVITNAPEGKKTSFMLVKVTQPFKLQEKKQHIT